MISSSSLSKRKHKAWLYICIAHLMRCIADRSFSFFMPLYLSKQCSQSTLRPTAALSFVQNLSVVLLSTSVAKVYKKVSSGFLFATIFENVAVVLIGVFLHVFLSESENHGASLGSCDKPLSSTYFQLALVCGAIDSIFSSLLSMVISKEWVALLFYKVRKDHHEDARHNLAKANAFLSQIDLAVGTICPLLVSYLISLYGYQYVLMIEVVQHIIGAVMIIFCIRRAVSLCPDLIDGTYISKTLDEKEERSTNEEKGSTTGNEPSDMSIQKMFKQQTTNTKLISVAYILLYFTILSPGAMLNAWMNSMNEKITETTIAYFGSISQFCGVIATFVTPLLIRNTKTLQVASAYSQWFQTICIWYGFYCFYQLNQLNTSSSDIAMSHEKNNASSLMLQFLISIGLSRIGLWSFDLVERQILQQSVPKEHQTLFFNGERSATQFLSLCMMAMCYIFPDPDTFLVLVIGSVMAVSLSSVLIFIQTRL